MPFDHLPLHQEIQQVGEWLSRGLDPQKVIKSIDQTF